FLQFAIQWSSIALLYYDYILTFPSELKYIWKSGVLKVSTGLYIFYRYALLANVLYLLAISNKLGNKVCRSTSYPLPPHVYESHHQPSCDAWYKAIGAFSVLGRAAVIFTFLMRTYVVYNKNTFILVGLGAIGLTCVILDCMHVPGVRCHGSSTNQLFAATSNGGAGGRRRIPRSGLSSLADEFGEDPVAMMSRATATATAHS
ncbi:hypothetical protein C8Q76DRAFT_600251, partial [Earliella scabrosa]